MKGTIYIETQPTLIPEQYALEQDYAVGGWLKQERLFTESHPNRMIASIVNCGLACRWAIDIDCHIVSIVPDTDGRAVKFDGEQNYLFEMVRTRRDYLTNRLKYISFYGRDIRLLDRIIDLASTYRITFVAQETPIIQEAKLREVRQNDRNTK